METDDSFQDREYILGNDLVEIAGLKLQHDLWANEAKQLWSKVGFAHVEQLLDLGCGPGFTTLALAQIMKPGSEITHFFIAPTVMNIIARKRTT